VTLLSPWLPYREATFRRATETFRDAGIVVEK